MIATIGRVLKNLFLRTRPCRQASSIPQARLDRPSIHAFARTPSKANCSELEKKPRFFSQLGEFSQRTLQDSPAGVFFGAWHTRSNLVAQSRTTSLQNSAQVYGPNESPRFQCLRRFARLQGSVRSCR